MRDPFKTASGLQSSGPWDPWLPVLENSRLFAQLAHSAQCAPAAAPACVLSFQGRGCTVATNPTSAHVPAHSGLYGGWLSAQNPHPFDGTLIVVCSTGEGCGGFRGRLGTAVVPGVGAWGTRRSAAGGAFNTGRCRPLCGPRVTPKSVLLSQGVAWPWVECCPLSSGGRGGGQRHGKQLILIKTALFGGFLTRLVASGSHFLMALSGTLVSPPCARFGRDRGRWAMCGWAALPPPPPPLHAGSVCCAGRHPAADKRPTPALEMTCNAHLDT